jgi:hypothetical protein
MSDATPVPPIDPPGRPRVPRPRPSLLTLLFGALCAGAIGLYVYDGVHGREIWSSSPAYRDRVPPSVRASPGGYRSFHFWHSGYQGGK